MKRSLTIGCVLLVGGSVVNCGGAVEMGSTPGEEANQAGGSGAPDGGFMGDRVSNHAGGGGIGIAGGNLGAAPQPHIKSAGGAGGADAPGAGAAGWEMGCGAGGWENGVMGAGAGPIAGAGGESGSSDEPPAVGTTPQGGTGGWMGVPPK